MLTIWANSCRYIDWTPFFQTWELVGRYPLILDDPQAGKAARDLFADAQEMLKRIVAEKWLTARAVIGFWPAAAEGDDIVLFYGRRGARHAAGDAAHASPADVARVRQTQSGAVRFRAPARRGASRIISAASSSPRGMAKKSTSSASRPTRTITPPSCCARWPTASRKPLPSACMQRVRKEFWAYVAG